MAAPHLVLFGDCSGYTTASTTVYGGALNTCPAAADCLAATRTPVQAPFNKPGTLSDFKVHIGSNSRASSSTSLGIEVNGSQTHAVTYSASETGDKSDAASVAIVAGDKANSFLTTGAGTQQIIGMGLALKFQPTNGTATSLVGCGTGATFSGGAGTSYLNNHGRITDPVTTEANAQQYIQMAGVAGYFHAYVSTNARTATSTTIQTRKNTADGNMSLVYSASETGYKQDATNHDTLAVADLYASKVVLGSDTGNFIIILCGQWIDSTVDGESMTGGSSGLGRNLSNSTTVGPVGGRLFSAGAADSVAQQPIPAAGTFSKMWMYCSAHTGGTNPVISMRKAAAAGNETLTITSATAFQDATNSDAGSTGDLFNIKGIGPTTGAVRLHALSFKVVTTPINIDAISAISDPNDTCSSAGNLVIGGSCAITDPNDTCSAAGNLVIGGSCAITDPNDTCSSDATISGGLTGAAAITDPNDTCSSAATLQITGACVITDPNDTCSSAATLQITGAAAITDPNDTCSSAGTLQITGTCAITDPNDTCSSAATLQITGACTITDPNDTCGAAGQAGGVAGTAGMTDANDTVSAFGSLVIAGTVGITDPNDTCSSAASLVNSATAAISDPNDTCNAAATLQITATAAISDPNDTCNAAAQIQNTGAVGCIDPNDTVVSSARFAGTPPNPRRFIVARRRATGRTAHRRITSKTAS